MRLGPIFDDRPSGVKNSQTGKKRRTRLRKSTHTLNKIPNDIVSTNDTDNTINALTNHMTTVVGNSFQKVPTNRRILPADVHKLMKAKNVALRRVIVYPTLANKSYACALQHKVLAIFCMSRFDGMIGRNSKMLSRNKRTLYKTCIRPVMTYASPVFAHVAPTALYDFQVIQNKFCRRATDARRYVK
ncbi:hypothetical protein EVAR_100411_1 [Eumeta japonica]|uniref:RNA-directed DNA polymerase from mobile element jockey n=1 Tax=Eumeta variegata TaxID=151549 RepID=A0A4C1ZT00_EUMVA|nr:hypothetical protein EVAR_100411_1 [Eumeta japonica]